MHFSQHRVVQSRCLRAVEVQLHVACHACYDCDGVPGSGELGDVVRGKHWVIRMQNSLMWPARLKSSVGHERSSMYTALNPAHFQVIVPL